MAKGPWLILLSIMLPFLLIAKDHSKDPGYFNNGRNILKPMTRLDITFDYENDTDGVGNETEIALRFEKVIDLEHGWQASFRADVRYDWFVCHCTDCSCDTTNRVGDTQLQALLITAPIGNWSGGAGLQINLPTAGDNSIIGDAKYELRPTVAAAYDLSDWSLGSYMGILFRQSFSIAGYANQPYINQTYIQPFLNINLLHKWFINSSPEIRYNWRTSRWFIPLDLSIGVMITKKFVISMEYEYALVRDFPRYKHYAELSIGYFF